MHRLILKTAGAALALGLAASNAIAQQESWPRQPIRLIVPVAPGGTSDSTARLLQTQLSQILGQQIIVDNKAGGAGTIATEAVVRSKPDGYTIGLIFTSHAANPALLPKLPFDSERDITPIAFFWRSIVSISVNKDAPFKSLGDIVSAARAKPGSVVYATGGVAQASHFGAAMLEKAAGITLTHAPFRGASPALNDAIAGHVPIVIANTTSAGPHVQSGSLRMLAVLSPKRSAAFPNVPTAAEAGFPVESSEWLGFIGPAGLPAAITVKLNAAINKALTDPDFAARLTKMDLVTEPMSPDQFKAFLGKETKRMTTLVKEAGITAE